MKVGIFGGGFKPFHTGHFGKVALALEENDKVYLFYGIESEKAKKPKRRKMGTSEREYTPQMSKEIFNITKDALEKKYPGRIEVIESPAPVGSVIDKIGEYKDGAADKVERIKVYGRSDDLQKYYLNMYTRENKQGENLGKRYFGDLRERGILRFGTISSDEAEGLTPDELAHLENERISGALRGTYPDATDDELEDYSNVSGTNIRTSVSSRDIDALRKYLPDFLSPEQEMQIINILLGDEIKTESIISSEISKNTMLRATARFINEKNNGGSHEETSAHILNFYEDFKMPIAELYELIDAAKAGELEEVQEKMDGQNITFTVQNNRLLFFSKGGGGQGKDRGAVGSHPVESVRNAFIKAYDAIEEVAIPAEDPGLWSELFKNGDVKIESALLTPENPNTIVYDEPSIRFIGVNSDDPDVTSMFNSFVENAKHITNESFYMGPVPYLKLKKSLETTDEEAEQIKQNLDSLLSQLNIEKTGTVGGIVGQMVRENLADSGLVPEELLEDAVTRVMTGKGPIGRVFPRVAGKEAWQKFNTEILKNRASYLALSIVDLERIIQRIGELSFKNLEFTLRASNRDDLINQVSNIKNAFKNQKIITDPKNLEGIRVALERIVPSDDQSEEIGGRFEQATEGIVFTWKGKTRKLTGLFTPINKLRGFFAYGQAEIQDDSKKELKEAVERILMRILIESNNAFRPRDSRGKSLGDPVTSSERIPRATATKIIDVVMNNVIKPLGLEPVLKAGSTEDNPDLLGGPPTETLGDVDLIVSVEDVDTLIAKLKGLPYLKSELVEGIPRVYPLGFGSARTGAAIMIELNGVYYQVDLFSSTRESIDDRAWELAGGGKDRVRGEYRVLMFSLLAKIKGERESTPDETVKYTIVFPGGWRKKINGIADETGRIVDPDDYLPLLDINVPKSEIRTFEALVSHMSAANTSEFKEALERFEEYIDHKLKAKDENKRASAQKAVDVVNTALSGDSSIPAEESENVYETHFRYAVRKLLYENDEVDDEPEIDARQAFDTAGSYAAKARVVLGILKQSDFLGADIEKITTTSPGLNLMRFGLKSGTGDNHDFNDIVNRLQGKLLPASRVQVVELAPYESPNPSGTYSAFMMPELDSLMIIFGVAGTAGGQRKAGYIYEDEIGEQLQAAGMNVRAETDNAYSDIYVATKDNELGIEVKLPNAQAGEPTMRYDYDKGEFFASNPKPQNQDIANLVNMNDDMPNVRKKMLSIRDGINSRREEMGDVKPIESILGPITRDEYTQVVHVILKDDPTGLKLAAYTVSTDALRDYYMHKGAGLVQVKGKGLYHLHPDFEVIIQGPGGQKKTRLFDFPKAKGAVYFRNNRGINYAMRTQFSAKPLTKLEQSEINLDNSADREIFARTVKDMKFPDSKRLVKHSSEIESGAGDAQESQDIRESLMSIIRRFHTHAQG